MTHENTYRDNINMFFFGILDVMHDMGVLDMVSIIFVF
jgi:hypothetical protein